MNNFNKLMGGTLLVVLSVVGVNEGLSLTSYQDTGGIWTDCYGRTKGVKPDTTTTQAECDEALTEDVLRHAAPLERMPHKLPDGVIIAWADFCYNVGVSACQNSTGYKALLRGDTKRACKELLRWKYTTVDGVKRDCSRSDSGCTGIWKRRQLEHRYCVGG